MVKDVFYKSTTVTMFVRAPADSSARGRRQRDDEASPSLLGCLSCNIGAAL